MIERFAIVLTIIKVLLLFENFMHLFLVQFQQYLLNERSFFRFGRNLVLGMWEKDVQHLLMVTDCGVSEEASGEEPPRASLVREIYRFLDYHVSAASSQIICCHDFLVQTFACTCIFFAFTDSLRR